VPDSSRRVIPGLRSGSDPAGSQSLSSSATDSRPPSSTTRPESSKTVAYDKGSLIAKPSFTMVSSVCGASSQTPSPELPNSPEPLTPEFKGQRNKKSTMKVLGLGTPEVEKWINAGKGEEPKVRKSKDDDAEGKPKAVYFKDEANQDEDSEEEDLMEKARKLSLQISPCRPVPSASGSTVDLWTNLAVNSPAHSAISHPANTSAASSSPAVSTSTAHDLLKTIVHDVMFDFQRETKAEMMGLHLDLLRMGRSWKAELRSLMDEYVGDLREMRDENERLRKENERLKRGWQ
jgi:protein NEDD1